MADQIVILEGSVGPDGILQLPEKIMLQPGKVRVTIEALNENKPDPSTLIELLNSVRDDPPGRTKEEVDRYIDEMRNEWDARVEESK